jgi:hypothetical protein
MSGFSNDPGRDQVPALGTPRGITDDHGEIVIVTTLVATAANATQRSTRSMVAATGMSQTEAVLGQELA